VNVASRMESTGEGGKIQVSASTAKLLTDAGKASWIQAREDKIHAKGKTFAPVSIPMSLTFCKFRQR
jgi:class 3 adenylate cyclase